jgi:hypothetical protein
MRAIGAWESQGISEHLKRWLDRELDDGGTPIRLSLSQWSRCLAALADARRKRTGWPPEVDGRVREWVQSLLRFSRADGSLATEFDTGVDRRGNRSFLSSLAKTYPRTGEARVIGWWLSLPEVNHVAPPLPAWSSDRTPLAVLRASWLKQGDMLIIDHRGPIPATRFELVGRGCSWLGPDWRLVLPGESTSQPKPGLWLSNSVADLVEWSYRSGGLRFTRTALLLRGRRLALLGEQIEGRAIPAELPEGRFGLPPGITAEPIPDSRGLLLRGPRKGTTAQVLPVSLPALPYETERGQFRIRTDDKGPGLSLKVAARGRRCWLPLIVSWDTQRHRKRLHWRVLTVSQQSKVCPPDVAFAVRVSWGRDETYVIYRSLARPTRRAFLGYQTRARFLIGQFTDDGTVEPLVSVD